MKILSVNCGLPRQVDWHGKPVTTSIFKKPVSGRVTLRTLNLDGDKQSDLTVHGGEHKALYCYLVQHYSYWKEELPGRDLPFGVFGENFHDRGRSGRGLGAHWRSVFGGDGRGGGYAAATSLLQAGHPVRER